MSLGIKQARYRLKQKYEREYVNQEQGMMLNLHM
jgi:hypothetical protein